MVYKLVKRIIERGSYDRTDIQTKLDVYLAFNRITQKEYEELCGMIAAYEARPRSNPAAYTMA